MNGDRPPLGYAGRLTVTGGDTLTIHANVHSGERSKVDAAIVRIFCADTRASGQGLVEEDLGWKRERFHWSTAATGDSDVTCAPGSYGTAGPLPVLDEWTVSCAFMPTLHRVEQDQTLFEAGDLRVTLRDGVLFVGGAAVRRVAIRRWHWLSVACRGSALAVVLKTLPRGAGEAEQEWSQTVECGLPTRLSGAPVFAASFNGRIELPWVARTALDPSEARALSLRPDKMSGDARIVAAWDFSREIGSDRIIDISGAGLDGRFVNHPTRAVRGVRWNGSVQDWTKDPSHYGAVHFHSDDLTDARWAGLLQFTIPDELPSGVYAVKLTRGEEREYISFFVRPSKSRPRAKAVFLVPTATYLAYANNRFPMYAALVNGRPLTKKGAILREHPELGWSLYDRHADGSGVHYSSCLRPIMDLKPCDDGWGFTADTNIIAWLRHLGVSCDVITDEDLDRDGVQMLAPYNVVITGTHPEYSSTRMLDGLEAYLGGGGRLMYMGGNGFYWRVAYDPGNPGVVELHRAEGRGRAWDAEPGEYYHSFSGEYGGLWRLLGRPPNRLVGVGFVALAQDDATTFQRLPAAVDRRASFIFEGTTEGSVFGAYGSMCGGAVSQEIDRWNPLLDSPRHALVLATSTTPSGDFMLCREEGDASYPGVEGPKLRADMVFFETPSGGAVFSTGSIGFAGALAHNRYDNDVCRIAKNVLERFLNPEPFPYPKGALGGTGFSL